MFKADKDIIFWQFCIRETYHNWMVAFSKLLEIGYLPLSVTSDKHGSLVSAVAKMFSHIPHQYCLVHIQRRCQTLLTKNPQTQAGKDLLELTYFINQIKTHSEKQIFLSWLARYEKRWGEFLKQRTYATDPNSKKKWWYTHKNLRAAFRHIKTSTDNMFFYLDNEDVPKDTNGLEAEFTHLKQKLNSHRGLTRKRQENFVKWYLFFKSPYNVR